MNPGSQVGKSFRLSRGPVNHYQLTSAPIEFITLVEVDECD
ncbi:uncharacterized protein METZ01_LOCUS39131 [marine metagenome]|uniref:Uncharacterized protein n=1 Tax=marine metagenome TaxID=408172 RepID=A0A381R8S8_9ZZZZ